MNKSFLTASVVGLFGAVVSGVALADNAAASTYCKPGFYAGVQLGRDDTFYKADDVLAKTFDSGYHGTFDVIHQNVDDVGMGGHLYAGYQFNPYFAVEAGYTQFSKTSFSADLSQQATPTVTNVTNITTDGVSGELTEHAIDLVGKATMPLDYGFGVYAKAGLAFVTAERHSTANVHYNPTFDSKTYQAVLPTYGVGVDYTIPNTSMDVDAFFTRTEGNGGIKPSSFFGLGLAYKFA